MPIGVIGIWLSTIFLPEIETTNPPPMDGKGFVLSGIAASGVVFGLSVVSLPALPPAIGIASTIIGFICGFLYLRHAARHPAPFWIFAYSRTRPSGRLPSAVRFSAFPRAPYPS